MSPFFVAIVFVWTQNYVIFYFKLLEKIIRLCLSIGKAVIVATSMLESMSVHSTPIRSEVSDIGIVVRERSNAVILYGETAHRNMRKARAATIVSTKEAQDEVYTLRVATTLVQSTVIRGRPQATTRQVHDEVQEIPYARRVFTDGFLA